jgi:hypothetical protein
MSEKVNILRKFRDEKSKLFKKLTAFDFIEIWKQYDINGNTIEL